MSNALDENAISRCKAFMEKNRDMPVGKMAEILTGRGYSADEFSAASMSLFEAMKEGNDGSL